MSGRDGAPDSAPESALDSGGDEVTTEKATPSGEVVEPHEDTPVSPRGEQDGPALAMHTTDDEERLDGLLAQIRADLAGQNAATVEHGLRQRLGQVGLQLDDDEVARIVRELAAS